jgi:hypothetical protein
VAQVADYEAAGRAVEKKTARLKALRLAKEEAGRQTAAATEAETTVLPACASRPSFGENQTDESASNRENPSGPLIRRLPFV